MIYINKALAFLGARATEATTYAGLLMIATTLGAGTKVGELIQAVGLIMGGGLVTIAQTAKSGR